MEPVCAFHRQCGGCQIQALSYEKQLDFKQKKVESNLRRIGGFPEELLQQVMEPIAGMENPFHYRNKAQFPVGTDKDGHVITGFYAGADASDHSQPGLCAGRSGEPGDPGSGDRFYGEVSYPCL